jgi:hypothetical protein
MLIGVLVGTPSLKRSRRPAMASFFIHVFQQSSRNTLQLLPQQPELWKANPLPVLIPKLNNCYLFCCHINKTTT